MRDLVLDKCFRVLTAQDVEDIRKLYIPKKPLWGRGGSHGHPRVRAEDPAEPDMPGMPEPGGREAYVVPDEAPSYVVKRVPRKIPFGAPGPRVNVGDLLEMDCPPESEELVPGQGGGAAAAAGGQGERGGRDLQEEMTVHSFDG